LPFHKETASFDPALTRSEINHKEDLVNYYELMVIFSPNLTEEEEKARVGQVQELLTGQKAEIHLSDHWGKRKLAYPIKKQRQGYYDWYYFEMDPSHVAEVDRKLKMDEQVLRFMMLKMEKIQVSNLHREVARRKEAANAPEPAPVEETPQAPTVAAEETPQPQPEAAAVETAAVEPTPES
jgi:small subunit ribosomal protein S6